jgi:hypothetical protein
MTDKLYKVGAYSEEKEILLDTKHSNYGANFSTKYDHFLDSYFNVATKIDLPIDFLVSVVNGIVNFGDDYINNNIAPAIVNEFYVDLFKVTKNPKHKSIVIPIQLLNDFIQSFDGENPFILFYEGFYLWERYFEMVRLKIFSDLPNRKQCLFFFDNLDDCNDYIKNKNGGLGQIYEVEILEQSNLFKGDMNLIDELDESITYNNILKEVFNYWDGKSSSRPIFEYLFEGKCKLKNLSKI